MTRENMKTLRKGAIFAVVLVVLLMLAPVFTVAYLICGALDVSRNKRKDRMVLERYFMGNGVTTFLLSPFNLLIDLFSNKNKGIWKLEDLPPEWRAEIDEVLGVFKVRREELIAEIDKSFESGRRGMYVYKWMGKDNPHEVAEFRKDFRYLKTIAVSVFSGRESTQFHFGPTRLTLRVLYNLTPVESDAIFIECQDVKHYWYKDPLYIFDDTLIHRSVNEHDARRFVVFMDIMRPTPFPALLGPAIAIASALTERINSVFYKNWKMLKPGAKPAEPAAPNTTPGAHAS